jgi:hypothetical protein
MQESGRIDRANAVNRTEKESRVTSYTVTAIRREPASDGSHHHIAGLVTNQGAYWPRASVVSSITHGDEWRTGAGPITATICLVSRCPRGTCTSHPYVATNPHSTRLDNLENLPEV